MKKELSYTEDIKYGRTIQGILLILLGFFGFFPHKATTILMIICVIVQFVICIIRVKAKCEKPDEMAQQNIYRAKAAAMDYMLLVACTAAAAGIVFFAHRELHIRLSTLIGSSALIFIGCSQLLIGILYRKYEEE